MVSYAIERDAGPPVAARVTIPTGQTGMALPVLLPSRSDALAPPEVVAIRILPGDGYRLGGSTERRYVLAGSEFARWQAVQLSMEQLLSGLGNPDADADGDGESNALEFATGGRARLEVVVDESGPVFEFIRRSGGVSRGLGIFDVEGLRYQIETSTNLIRWTSSGDALERVGSSVPVGPGQERVRFRLKAPASFLRLRILALP